MIGASPALRAQLVYRHRRVSERVPAPAGGGAYGPLHQPHQTERAMGCADQQLIVKI